MFQHSYDMGHYLADMSSGFDKYTYACVQTLQSSIYFLTSWNISIKFHEL